MISLDFSLNHTFSLTSTVDIPVGALAIKGYSSNEIGLLARFTVQGVVFDFYYFPRARTLCVTGQGLGSFSLAFLPGHFYSIEITSSSVTLNGQARSFDSAATICPGASNLAISAGFLLQPLGELRSSDAYFYSRS